ncbi:tRNA (N(6)-L-threonylcarbamoyladenosine(37)-C(2))-methylthiotransferase MtaB [candidate division KSB3 bacterium]|uniref:Threonylcarbamoyladenosine tRNA methylthiotransferase MtaB n=1 Tax=candidate division KSB3 bacterium TaxID=2044937 RepID=A0A9D5JRR8_9BACT|nr:tRNA (N(6)-L-threonylcarbamoyladenosine(37)-C(2))-methylthiotransferase MtaB [candidate division KSB3 bacterium]MBD3323058.1 tRNA (N(6)-L-threonylcarbamoyladenosine(37)-C(2))-methylthiotransferase MtaB [candidate division KSB3 bacterium]
MKPSGAGATRERPSAEFAPPVSGTIQEDICHDMHHQYSASFYTLGCRLNQAETAILCDQFRESGYAIKPFGEPTDVCVINTCSVTGASEARCRNMIRSVLRKHPANFLIVVGCYAQVGLEAIRAIPGVDMIVGTEQKFEITSYLADILAETIQNRSIPKRAEPLIIHSTTISREDFTLHSVGNFVEHVRANIKIQDGCNFFCSYCIVPYTRGRERSRTFADIRREALQLAQRGHQEVVITGVNIGRYAYRGYTLLDVVKMLEDIEGIQRIRITSIEPMTIPDGLIGYVTSSPKVCHFFHIPLQSGDNTILRQMNRRYTREEFAEFVRRLAADMSDVNIGTDIIVGFPGEGEAEFEHSRQLLETLPLNYAHVFSFSPRQGTQAATLPQQVHPETIKQRSQILRKLSARKRRAFYERYLGQSVSVLFEYREKTGLFTGYTGNYLKVGVSTEEDLTNRFRQVVITEIADTIAIGTLTAASVITSGSA